MWIDWTVLLVFLLCFVAIFAEAYDGKRRGIIRELERMVMHLHSDIDSEMIPNGELVFFRSNNTSYNLVYDRDTNIAEFCGCLKRKIQYCVWDPYENFCFTRWVDYLSCFDCLQVQKIPALHFYNSMKAGTFTISTSLSYNGRTKTLVPIDQQLNQFLSSPYGSEFQYTGRGIFYSDYYKKGRIDKFFGWSTAGDRKIWYEYWAPDSVTVLGKYHDGVIELAEYKGYSIGSVTSGHVNVRKALSQNMSLFPVIMKWICRAVTAGYLLLCFYCERQADIFNDILFWTSIVLSHPVVNNYFYTNKSITYIALFSGLATLPTVFYQFAPGYD